jgi:hypothetical protein
MTCNANAAKAYCVAAGQMKLENLLKKKKNFRQHCEWKEY